MKQDKASPFCKDEKPGPLFLWDCNLLLTEGSDEHQAIILTDPDRATAPALVRRLFSIEGRPEQDAE